VKRKASGLAIAGWLGLMLVWSSGIAAQDWKQDGKDFANDVLIDMGKNVLDGDLMEVPHFTNAPPGTDYQEDPAGLAADAEAAKATNEGYLSILDSQNLRATFDPDELQATVAPGTTIQQHPAHYTSGMSIDGSTGSCVELPRNSISPGSYEQSCNEGYTQVLPSVEDKTCSIGLNVDIRTKRQYWISEPATLNTKYNQFAAEPQCTLKYGPLGKGGCTPWIIGFEGGGETRMCNASNTSIAHVFECTATMPGDYEVSYDYRYVPPPVVATSRDESTCSVMAGDPDCTADGGEVCTDSDPVTRTIDGVAVTQPCWAWQQNYTCDSGEIVVGTPASDCQQLEDMGCTWLREECLTNETPCLTTEVVYKCPLPAEEDPEPGYICDGDVYCIHGECETIEREAQTGFQDALVALNTVAQAGQEFNEDTLTVFTGDPLACTKLVFGVKNCCVPRGFPLIGGCGGEDQILRDRREDGQCTYAGSWCTTKVLGVCMAKKERHCCFASKLTRVIQEQGRPQLGKTWNDNPEDETCQGFTIDEFSQLDLSVMDFAEVYADFTEAANIPQELEVLNDMQQKVEDYFALHSAAD